MHDCTPCNVCFLLVHTHCTGQNRSNQTGSKVKCEIQILTFAAYSHISFRAFNILRQSDLSCIDLSSSASNKQDISGNRERKKKDNLLIFDHFFSVHIIAYMLCLLHTFGRRYLAFRVTPREYEIKIAASSLVTSCYRVELNLTGSDQW